MSDKGTGLIRAIFDTDNFFMQICEKILDLMTVNLLFLLSCLPLVTIGIAKISLYQTLFEIKGNRKSNQNLHSNLSRKLEARTQTGLAGIGFSRH